MVISQIAGWVFHFDFFFVYLYQISCAVRWKYQKKWKAKKFHVFDFGAYVYRMKHQICVYILHSIWKLRPWYLNEIEWLLFGIWLLRNWLWSPTSNIIILLKRHFIRSLEKFRSNLSEITEANYFMKIVLFEIAIVYSLRCVFYIFLNFKSWFEAQLIKLFHFSFIAGKFVEFGWQQIYLCFWYQMSRIRICFIIWNVTYLWII